MFETGRIIPLYDPAKAAAITESAQMHLLRMIEALEKSGITIQIGSSNLLISEPAESK